MYSILLDIFWVIILINLLALAVMVVFFINARINLQRQVVNTKFFIRTLNASKVAKTTLEAAEMLKIDLDEFTTYCRMKGIESPEKRIENKERIERIKQEEEQKILKEEAAWHVEQERALERKRKEQEEASQERKDRLKKFGFK